MSIPEPQRPIPRTWRKIDPPVALPDGTTLTHVAIWSADVLTPYFEDEYPDGIDWEDES